MLERAVSLARGVPSCSCAQMVVRRVDWLLWDPCWGLPTGCPGLALQSQGREQRQETALEGASELVHGSDAGRGVPVAPRVTCPGTVCVFSRPSTVRRHGKSSCQPRRATYGSAPGSRARWCAGPGRVCTVRCSLRAHGCRHGITWAKHATGPPRRGPASETLVRGQTPSDLKPGLWDASLCSFVSRKPSACCHQTDGRHPRAG